MKDLKVPSGRSLEKRYTINWMLTPKPNSSKMIGNLLQSVNTEGPPKHQLHIKSISVVINPRRLAYLENDQAAPYYLSSKMTHILCESHLIFNRGHLNSIFQPVIGQIVDLVRSQVSEIREITAKKPKVFHLWSDIELQRADMKPKAVLLVGGFGENNFLMNQLTKTFPVPIQRPTNA